jgi:hypothetical protein
VDGSDIKAKFAESVKELQDLIVPCSKNKSKICGFVCKQEDCDKNLNMNIDNVSNTTQ